MVWSDGHKTGLPLVYENDRSMNACHAMLEPCHARASQCTFVRTEQSVARSACASRNTVPPSQGVVRSIQSQHGPMWIPIPRPCPCPPPSTPVPHQSSGCLHLASSGVANDLWAYVAGLEQSNFSHTRPIARSLGFAHQGGSLGMSLRGGNSIGRVPALQAGSWAFESPPLHCFRKPKNAVFLGVFGLFVCA